MKKFEIRIGKLYNQCLKELEALSISTGIVTTLRINNRAKKRLGCCKMTKSMGRKAYMIEVSNMLEEEDDKTVKEVLHHELIHTCPGCFNHGAKWKKTVSIINDAYGYDIKARAKYSSNNEEKNLQEHNYKFMIECSDCGNKVYRMRRSKVTDNPDSYRCSKCGGKIKVISLFAEK